MHELNVVLSLLYRGSVIQSNSKNIAYLRTSKFKENIYPRLFPWINTL